MNHEFAKSIIENNYDQLLELNQKRKLLLFSGAFLFFGFLLALSSYKLFLSRFSEDLLYFATFAIYVGFVIFRGHFDKKSSVNIGDAVIVGFITVFYLLDCVFQIDGISEGRSILLFSIVCLIPMSIFGFKLAFLSSQFSMILKPEIIKHISNYNLPVSLIDQEGFDFKSALAEPIASSSSWSRVKFAFSLDSRKSTIYFADVENYSSSKNNDIFSAAIISPDADFGDKLSGIAHYPMEITNFSKLKWPIGIFILLINLAVYLLMHISEADNLLPTFFTVSAILSSLIIAIAAGFVLFPKFIAMLPLANRYGLKDLNRNNEKFERLRDQLGGEIRSIGSLEDRGAFVTYYVSPMDKPNRFISPYSSLFGSFLSPKRYKFIAEDLAEIIRILRVIESNIFPRAHD